VVYLGLLNLRLELLRLQGWECRLLAPQRLEGEASRVCLAQRLLRPCSALVNSSLLLLLVGDLRSLRHRRRALWVKGLVVVRLGQASWLGKDNSSNNSSSW